MLDDNKGPRYGEVHEANLDPALGVETGKTRPVLIVSNDISNRYSSTVTVLPITGKPLRKEYPFEVAVPANTAGLSVASRVKANQIRTLDKQRLVGFRGVLPQEYLVKVNRALRIHLNIT
jgi:mRNA interferase MazF